MPGKKASKKTTLIDVARHAGVSRATASLVLRNSPLVADTTREQVLASMRELGYVYNRAAANLRSRESRTIGLVVTDVTNPFFAELAVSIESRLTDANYAVLLSNTLDDLNKQDRLLQIMNGHQADGILLCPAENTPTQTLELLRRWNLPFVLIARYLPESECDYAGADNVAGAGLAVKHLFERGHRRIAFLGGNPHSSARRERLLGYQNALNKLGLGAVPGLSVFSPVSRRGGYEALLNLLDQPDPPTAALCYNDVVAFGGMLALQSKNMTPGQDFAIVGFDNIADAALVRPALTTVAISPEQIGEAAIELLLKRIEATDAPPQRRVLAPKLVIRNSS